MEFQHYWLILKRHWLPAVLVFGSVSALTVLTLAIQKPIYQAEGRLRFTKADTTSSLTGLLDGKVGEFDPLLADNNPITTEIEVIRSVPTIQETIDRLHLKDADGHTLKRQDFLDHLKLTSTRGTDLLQVAYQDRNSELTRKVVDTLMAIYLEKHLLDNRADTMTARKFIEQQLPEAEASVRQADIALRRFKEANHIAALDEEAAAIVEASEDLRHRIAEAQSELASTNAQSTGFSQELRMNPQEAIAAVSLSQSPGVQQVLTALQEVESQLATERVRFQDNHPVIKALNTRKAYLEDLLNQRIQQTLNRPDYSVTHNLQIGELRAALVGDFIRNEVKSRGLQSQVSSLTQIQSAYNQRISAIPRLQQQQRELERKLEAAQSTYSVLLERLHEVRIAENQNVGNARVIQAATVLEDPIAPRKSVHLLTGFMLGILLGAGTTFVLEASDRSIRTVKEIKTAFRLPVLGIIPFQSKPQRWLGMGQSSSSLIVKNTPTSPVGEAYRKLQIVLTDCSSKKVPKTIVITSSVPQEGKSFVSSNLAMAIAQLGRHVLLIDADMRCPVQHKIWNLSNDLGLSHVLTETAELTTVIQALSENLHVLTAGKMPSNPAALLESQVMTELINHASIHYDVVILDTPALNAAADVLMLGKKADGIVFVARPGVVDGVSATLAQEQLERSEQPILGLVVNGVQIEHEAYRSYYTSPDSFSDSDQPNYWKPTIAKNPENRDAA
ncbi:MAG TPA: polysaccharide biosynthesis tyrosine autokinase [Crinalium sp.]|jgi:capsular exopolysaccharide synthesis family protein